MKAKNIAIIVKKELRGLINERTILLAILLQLFVALFSSFLMVGLTSMYDPSSLSKYSRFRYSVAYVGNDSALNDYLSNSRDFAVFSMELSPAVTALQERKLAAVVYVPDTAPDAQDPVKITLYTLENDLQSAIVNVKLKDIFLSYEKDLRTLRKARITEQPVPLAFNPTRGGGDFFEFVYGLLIPLLLFMPAIIASALVIDLITEEYQHETLETLIASPVTFSEMVWGKVIACEILIPIQAGAWIFLLVINRIAILNIPQIFVLVTISSLVPILIGALTALHYRERTAAQFIFSTALVVVLLLILAIPANPLNMVTRLAVGSAGTGQWLVLAGVAVAAVMISVILQLYAGKVGREHHAG